MASTWMDFSSRARNPVFSLEDNATYLAAITKSDKAEKLVEADHVQILT